MCGQSGGEDRQGCVPGGQGVLDRVGDHHQVRVPGFLQLVEEDRQSGTAVLGRDLGADTSMAHGPADRPRSRAARVAASSTGFQQAGGADRFHYPEGSWDVR
ncbi:MAG: hypothetical protein WKF79_06190 [Nocardioides sp.]